MNFSVKIFSSVFLTTLALGSFVIWSAYSHVSNQNREEYVSRYSAFSKVMADTLTQLDSNTEALMLNAAKVIAARDAENGLLSTASLKRMTNELSVTHIFVVDNAGKFIRSTNEDPKLIPNAFSFCEDYRNLYSRPSGFLATPIIQPRPEPKPYKFLFVPNRDHNRLLEVGVRVDFVAKTLTEALGADANLISLSLFAPDGNLFGQFDSKNVQFTSGKIILPEKFPFISETTNSYKFFTKVVSSHPRCCQCEVSGTSRNGEYYYILASEISKKDLKVLQAKTKDMFFILAIANLFFAVILSRVISRRLVKNIEMAVAKVRSIKESGNLKNRINLEGKDEVAFLTNEFDRMLDSVEESQERVIEAEKIQIIVQMAKEIAHNIKSPAIAIEMMIPMLGSFPEKFQKVFRDSVREIKSMTERLSHQADSASVNCPEPPMIKAIPIERFVKDVIQEKQVEYSRGSGSRIKLLCPPDLSDSQINVEPSEFKSVLSNIINNAVEAYPQRDGVVCVEIKTSDNECIAKISDQGIGIPAELLPHLGLKGVSLKVGGKGVGMMHASRMIASWGGELIVESSVGAGTTVSIKLPKYKPNNDSIAI